jgi:hypothetical protein
MAVEEFHPYIENNKGFISNYGKRYRCCKRGSKRSTVRWGRYSSNAIQSCSWRRNPRAAYPRI